MFKKLRTLAQRRLLLVLAVAASAALFLSACGSPHNSWPGLVGRGELLYFTNGSQLVTLDAGNGGEVWTYPADSKLNGMYPSATLAEGQILLTSNNHFAYALNGDGQLDWEREISRDQLVASAATDGETVFVAAAEGTLHALDAETGAELWAYDAGTTKLWAAPLVEDGVVYLPSLDHTLRALDAETGSELWSLGLAGALADTPKIVGGVLYTGSLSNFLYAIDPASGEILWQFEATGWVWSTPTIVDGVLYFGDLEGKVFALEDNGETLLWQAQREAGVRAAPAVNDDFVFVGDDGDQLAAYAREDGTQVWSIDVDENNKVRLLGSPVLYDDMVIVAPHNSGKLRVFAYRQLNGQPVWTYESN